MNGSASDLARYRGLLRSVAPDFAIDHFDYLGQGWDNILFVANGVLVVRFAKDGRPASQLLAEGALLRLIGPLLPVRIPTPDVFAQIPTERDAALMAYRLIPGVSLGAVSITEVLVAAIAPALARFLDDLHSVPFEVIEAIGIPRFTPQTWVEHEHDLYRRMRDDLRDALDGPTFRRYDAWLDNYLTDRASTQFEPTLVHGDLAPEHILIEQHPWHICGVIDFGDSMWTDPVLDLAGFPNLLARSVAERMLTSPHDEAFWRRRDAYRRIAPLHAVAAGRERSSPDLLRSGIEGIQAVTVE